MAGIQKIKIPVRANELTIKKIEPYLQYILGVFNEKCQYNFAI